MGVYFRATPRFYKNALPNREKGRDKSAIKTRLRYREGPDRQ